MSNVFGYISESNKNLKKNEIPIHFEEPIIKQGGLTLYLNGNSDTTFFSYDEVSKSGFIVVGVGLREENNHIKHLDLQDWQELYNANLLDKVSIQGHYLCIVIQNNKITFCNDNLGLRTLYYHEKKDHSILFSTRLDWLGKAMPNPTLSLSNFSSFWLLTNQINHGAFIHNVNRMGPNGRVEIVNGKIYSYTWSNFVPSWDSYTFDFFKYKLELFSNVKSNKEVALGLSGGLDSRALLQLLDKKKSTTFSFGNQDNPDIKMARKASSAVGITHEYFETSVPTFKENEAGIIDFVGQTNGTNMCYQFDKQPILEHINNNSKIVIDGAFGELFRRQYLGKLYFLNFNKPSSIKIENIHNALKTNRMNLFKHEIHSDLLQYSVEHIREVWTKIVSIVPNDNLADAIDLFSIWSRTNIAAMDHSWYDSHITAFMPFVQKDLLEIIFGIKSSKRKNGKLFRNIIAESRELNRLKLVKDGVVYPYAFGKLGQAGYMRINRKFGQPYTDNIDSIFLEQNKEFVLDILYRNETRNYSLYDYKNIENTVNSFYSGKKEYASFINQWLSFELWRESSSIS